MKEWITVAEAAALIGRHRSQIYRWIDNQRLASRTNAEGLTEVLAKAVVRIEPTIKRGRPRGTSKRA